MQPSVKVRFSDFIKEQTFAYFLSVLLAFCSVFFGLLPYYLVYQLLITISYGINITNTVIYASLILFSFALQILMNGLSTAISHKTAFLILERVRLAIIKKIMHIPLGYIQKKGS